ncbi:hypothetical protein D3C77_571780 [compost metagenome]
MRFERKRIIGWNSVFYRKREFANDEPVLIARLLSVLQYINEWCKLFAGMVKDRIEQDAYSALMTSLNEFL